MTESIFNDVGQRLQLFGQRLAAGRKKRGLRQKDLAELCETSQRVQSGYERGDVAPKIDYLFKLDALGYNIHELVANDKDAFYMLNNREQTVLDLYREATAETKLAVLEILVANALNESDIGSQSNQANIAGVQANIKKVKK